LLALAATSALCVTAAHGATIIIDPNPAKTGQNVTFFADPPDSSYSWDLDGDGIYGDKTGSTVTWGYTSPRTVVVGLLPPGATQPVTQLLPVKGPSPNFVVFPALASPGETVTFAYSSSEATSAIQWDLNGDGGFPDASGPIASRSFAAPGIYPVSLRVTGVDNDPPQAVSTATQFVTVKGPPPVQKLANPALRLMTPFPVVRITGRIGRRGARIRRLIVTAPSGATITVRCHGRGCPFSLARQTVAVSGKSGASAVRIRKFERRLLRVGATVRVSVSKSGEIGKYTRFRIRRGKPPLRRDLCVVPGKSRPTPCPQT
jgi:PKD domain-containing protein